MQLSNTNQTILNFSSWAAQTYTQKKEILELMLESDSPLDRIIAADIIKAAEGAKNA